MASICPQCHQFSLFSSDIDTIANATALTKIQNRMQNCCQNCGWLEIQQDRPEQFYVANEATLKVSSPALRNSVGFYP
jgi:hypothetical protein